MKSLTLYENAELFFLNKPPGTPSLPSFKGPTAKVPSAVELACELCPVLRQIKHPDHPLEHGLLHRLDTGTSGVLAFAKTLPTWKKFRALWKENVIQKHYRAIAPLLPSQTLSLPFVITTPMGHDKKSIKRMRTLPPASLQSIRGRPLQTKTQIHALIHSDEGYGDYWIQIHTGVRHQIRCHLASHQAPLLGDRLYGGKPSSRLWLHAWKIKIESLEVEAPLPEGWQNPLYPIAPFRAVTANGIPKT